jgi:predicted ester cyclase
MGHHNLVERLWQAMENGTEEQLASVVTPDVEFRMPGATMRGLQELWGLRQGWWTAFPDLKHEIIQYVENGDTFACELHVKGTHSGPMQTPQGTIAATGKRVVFESCDYIRFRDGKVSSWHAYTDMLSFQHQLGLLPK